MLCVCLLPYMPIHDCSYIVKTRVILGWKYYVLGLCISQLKKNHCTTTAQIGLQYKCLAVSEVIIGWLVQLETDTKHTSEFAMNCFIKHKLNLFHRGPLTITSVKNLCVDCKHAVCVRRTPWKSLKFMKYTVCFLTGLHSDRVSHWLQIFSWHVDWVTGLSDESHRSGVTVTEVSVPLAWTWVTWRQMTWRCWVPGPHFLLHSDHSPTSQLSGKIEMLCFNVDL